MIAKDLKRERDLCREYHEKLKAFSIAAAELSETWELMAQADYCEPVNESSPEAYPFDRCFSEMARLIRFWFEVQVNINTERDSYERAVLLGRWK